MHSDRAPTSTFEFLTAVDPSSTRLPTFEPACTTRPGREAQATRRRFPIFAVCVAVGFALMVLSTLFLLN